jgi:hypothetical protein
MTYEEAKIQWEKYLEYLKNVPPGCVPGKPRKDMMRVLRENRK